VRECEEEASIPSELARKAKAVGTIRFALPTVLSCKPVNSTLPQEKLLVAMGLDGHQVAPELLHVCTICFSFVSVVGPLEVLAIILHREVQSQYVWSV